MVLRPPSTQGSQKELSMRYLEGMAKLDYYLIKKQSFSNDVSDYFDVSWPIGKKEIALNITSHQSLNEKREDSPY